MPHSCIRLVWFVSTVPKRRWSPGAGLALKGIYHGQASRHVQATHRQFFSSVTSRTVRGLQRPAESGATDSKYKYTAPQIARAASQAVRVAIREGKYRDAFYIVNSALQFPLERDVIPPTVSRRLLNPINFRQGIPTRLVAHTLVHALMRQGHSIRVAREIQKMVAMGLRFRTHTIEASVDLLCSGPSRSLSDEPPFPSDGCERMNKPSYNDWRVNHILLAECTRLIPETRLALNLLSAARQSRHQRTERMYGWVVDACLLQGEIFVATLLFVVLVKDWQLRKVLKSSAVEPDRAASEVEGGRDIHLAPDLVFRDLRRQALVKEIGLDGRGLKIPYPEKTILQRILDCIDRRLFADSSTVSKAVQAESEKSLTYLANLIDKRSIPFGQLAPLLRALYSLPRSRCKVHLLEDGRDSHVNAYNYSHQVLLRLCQSPPSQKPKPIATRPEVLPQLDTRAYNALLYYALRHRLSPPLADVILEHMTVYRSPPLQPDIVTYNILLHSASTLRCGELANKVLNTLRDRHENKNRESPKFRHFRTILPNTNLTPTWDNYEAEDVTVPSIRMPGDILCHYARVHPIHADVYTLCTYITHLVRTGRPEIVADIIFYILPELYIIDHPANDSPSAHEFRNIQRQVLRRTGIPRAIEYGPYVFGALLNALQKAGKTGLAERVWLLARRAERASWTQAEGMNAVPWCLPIQAYTSMMKCYANEGKKGEGLIRGSRYSKNLSSSLAAIQEQKQVWEPQRTGNIYVMGWAHFFLKMQARKQGFQSAEPPLRWKTARDVGYLLLGSMQTGALSVWRSLINMQAENVSSKRASSFDSLELPVCDARFFNAVLDMFGRRPAMQSRRVRASPSWWGRKLRIAQKIYGESGWTSMTYDHTVVDIARIMTQAGYTLPLGLRRALVGYVSLGVPHVDQQEVNVRPFAFPRPKNSRSRLFSLNIMKSRGLPLGRRKPEMMRMVRVRERRAALKKIRCE